MGAAWRPWPGLAQAGLSGEKKTDPREAGNRFFFPRSVTSFVSPGKNGFMFSQQAFFCTAQWGKDFMGAV